MAKKMKSQTVVVKCACSTYGQVAIVSPNVKHNFCKGLKITKPLTGVLKTLHHPGNRGVWTPVPATENVTA